MIVCGGNHIVIQNEKNEIYVCGRNMEGQLGLGDNNNRDTFEKVEYDFGEIKNIACGGCHTVIQNEKNEIYVCGHNGYGQLGLGDNKDRDNFEKVVENFGEIKKITCGLYHTIIQNEKNEIYVCGKNDVGQLGLGDYKHRNTFEKVKKNFGEIKKIVCGAHYTVIQDEIGEIYVCGKNMYGQFGLGYNNRNIFEKVTYNIGEIKNITCGYCHIVIQNEKNEIYVCGWNVHGQLGLGDNINRNKLEKVEYDFGEIKNIACGVFHTVIYNEKNEIYVCGNNQWGQLGFGDGENMNKFEKIEQNFGEVKKTVCRNSHTVIQNKNNEIYVCGCNGYGQLGLGDYKDRNIFERVNTNDIFERIYHFDLKLNIEEIVL